MEWYYAKDGQQHGPVAQENLLELFRNGSIRGSDLVWNDTMTDWVPLSSVSGLVPSPEPGWSSGSAATGPLAGAVPAAAGAALLSSSLPANTPIPPTYLWQSIVCVLLCCWPFAIPAIIFGTKVKPAMEAGDYGAALEASKKAKMWCLVSFIVGFLLQAIFVLFAIVSEFNTAG